MIYKHKTNKTSIILWYKETNPNWSEIAAGILFSGKHSPLFRDIEYTTDNGVVITPDFISETEAYEILRSALIDENWISYEL